MVIPLLANQDLTPVLYYTAFSGSPNDGNSQLHRGKDVKMHGDFQEKHWLKLARFPATRGISYQKYTVLKNLLQK